MQQRVPTAEEMSLFWELMGQVGQHVSEESTFLQMNFDEFLEAVGQIFEIMFDRLGNENKSLIEAIKEDFEETDTNQDGKISKEEVSIKALSSAFLIAGYMKDMDFY